MVNVPPRGHSEHPLPFAPGADGVFGAEWHGYHYEAVGLLRRLRLGDHDYTAPEPGPPGPVTRWEMAVATAGLPLIGAEPVVSLAPWWMRAYQPDDDGDEPALVAEVRWWPGLDERGLWPFFRINLPRDQAPTTAQLNAAHAARSLLSGAQTGVKLRIKQTGRPSKDEAAIRSTLDPVIRSLRAKGLEPTEERVADHLPRKRGRPRDPRVVRRWVNEKLGMRWPDYIGSVE